MSQERELPWFVPVGLLLAAAPATLGLFAAWQTHSDPLEIEPKRADLGNVVAGRKYSAEFKLQNASNERINIMGAQTDCGCVFCSDFPIVVEPQATRSFSFAVHIPEKQPEGPLEHKIRLLVSDRGWVALIAVTGNVVQSKISNKK